jgi:hypothetical protein
MEPSHDRLGCGAPQPAATDGSRSLLRGSVWLSGRPASAGQPAASL